MTADDDQWLGIAHSARRQAGGRAAAVEEHCRQDSSSLAPRSAPPRPPTKDTPTPTRLPGTHLHNACHVGGAALAEPHHPYAAHHIGAPGRQAPPLRGRSTGARSMGARLTAGVCKPWSGSPAWHEGVARAGAAGAGAAVAPRRAPHWLARVSPPPPPTPPHPRARLTVLRVYSSAVPRLRPTPVTSYFFIPANSVGEMKRE